MNKIKAFGRKNWVGVAIVAFIIGVGSLTGAMNRGKEIASNPKSALTQ